ncbi:hypothetical protein T484DRAFT_1836541 [Baffinella frigidus]|nr:hypothetical protein T484DRAFT_1836541 [Cryptophyta sp. CCMP2293]
MEAHLRQASARGGGGSFLPHLRPLIASSRVEQPRRQARERRRSQTEVESAVSESPAAQELIASLEATLQPLSGELGQECFDALVLTLISACFDALVLTLMSACFDALVLTLISDHIVAALERLVLGKKAAMFSAVGAMLLDKDLRAIEGLLASASA